MTIKHNYDEKTKMTMMIKP